MVLYSGETRQKIKSFSRFLDIAYSGAMRMSGLKRRELPPRRQVADGGRREGKHQSVRRGDEDDASPEPASLGVCFYRSPHPQRGPLCGLPVIHAAAVRQRRQIDLSLRHPHKHGGEHLPRAHSSPAHLPSLPGLRALSEHGSRVRSLQRPLRERRLRPLREAVGSARGA